MYSFPETSRSRAPRADSTTIACSGENVGVRTPAGRSLRADAFVLGSGEQELGVYPIEFVDARSGPEHTTIYQLHHRADVGYEDVLVLAVGSQRIPTLHVGASPEPWTRSPAD